MSRQAVLDVVAAPYAERRRQIESEPLPRNIDELLDSAAKGGAPERIAWNFFEQGERITYATLRARVSGLASGLARAGVGKGSHVGVMLPKHRGKCRRPGSRSARLGAVMVPINIAIHAARNELRRRRRGCRVSRCRRCALDTLAALPERPEGLTDDRIFVVGKPRLGQRDWNALFDAAPTPFPPGQVDADDLVNIQYTSGTTGFRRAAC